MKLNSKEIKQIERFLYRLEKDSNQWPWKRWFLLLLSSVFIASSIYMHFKTVQITEMGNSLYSLHEKRMDAKAIELFLEGKLTNLKIELVLSISYTIKGLLGAVLFLYTVVNWNRHIKSKIKANIIQKFIIENE